MILGFIIIPGVSDWRWTYGLLARGLGIWMFATYWIVQTAENWGEVVVDAAPVEDNAGGR